MAFLAPFFLALGVLAGVPLLIHLLRRRIGRIVEFPAVAYLLRMEREHSRERKLKNRFLLLRHSVVSYRVNSSGGEGAAPHYGARSER